jgi:hypothetical protein
MKNKKSNQINRATAKWTHHTGTRAFRRRPTRQDHEKGQKKNKTKKQNR